MPIDPKCDPLVITPKPGREVIRIANDGRVFWNGREVETDDDFRAAMLDLCKHLFPQNKGLTQ